MRSVVKARSCKCAFIYCRKHNYYTYVHALLVKYEYTLTVNNEQC